MSEKLYQRCPMCRGTRKTLSPAMVDGPNYRGPLKPGSPCPCCEDGYVDTGLTLGQVERSVAERDKLTAFKRYVHGRLDAAGVTADPEGPHRAEGCRVGGRLDEVFAERDRLRAANLALADRVAAQSELLGRMSEAAPAPGRGG